MRAHGVYWAAGTSAALTVALLGVEAPLAVPGPAFHAAVETAAGCVASLAAGLATARFRIGRQVRDLALAVAFASFAVANLAFSTVPAVVASDRLAVFDTYAALTVRVLAAAVFCSAAFLPARRVSRGSGLLAVVVTGTGWLTVAGVVAVAAPWLSFEVGIPQGVAARVGAAQEQPFVVAAQSSQLLLYSAAVVGLRRRALREADVVAYVLAIAAVLSAFARLNYLLYPSLYADVVYTGDFFRLGFYGTVLAAMVVELRLRYGQAALLSALQERRRLARDLHDGLAQELAFIAARGRLLARRAGGSPQLDEVVSAAERALDEARRAIAALAQPTDLSLPELLERTTGEVASRHGVHVHYDLPEGDVPITSGQREMLIRVAREAVANAARHASAQQVAVALSNIDTVRLTVSDDGVGFDPDSLGPQGHHFGLTSMRERAEAAGAHFALRSAPGAGTTVEVTLQ